MNVETIITNASNPFKLNLKELWQYRELLWTMSMRDFKVRYANTFLGFAWAFLNPMATIAILAFIISLRGKPFPGATPPLVMVACGYTAWVFFQTLFNEGGSAIIQSQNMVRKIYFPRIILPLSKGLTGLIDLAVSFLIMSVLLIYFKVEISSNIVYLPVFILLTLMCGLAGALWVSALSIRFRDFKIITPFISRLGLFLSCIMYSFSSLPQKVQFYFSFNPIIGLVEGFRWCITGNGTLNNYMFISLSCVFLLFISGLFFFNSMERKIADLI